MEGRTLPDLPAELLLDIADHLAPEETAALALTCREVLDKLGTRVLSPPRLCEPDWVKLMSMMSAAGDFLPKIFCSHCRVVHLHLPGGSNSSSHSNTNSSSWHILQKHGKFGFKTGIDMRHNGGDDLTRITKPPYYVSGVVGCPNYDGMLHFNEVMTVMASYRRRLLLTRPPPNQNPSVLPTLRIYNPTEGIIYLKAMLSGMSHFDKVHIEIYRRNDEGKPLVQATAKIHRYVTYRIVDGNLLSKTEIFIYPTPAGVATQGASYRAPRITQRFDQTRNKWVYASTQVADADLTPYQSVVKKLSDIFHDRAPEPVVSRIARERFAQLKESCAHNDWVTTFPGLFDDFPIPGREVPLAHRNRGLSFFGPCYGTRRYTYNTSMVFGGRVCEVCMGHTDNLCWFVELPEEMLAAQDDPVEPLSSKKMKEASTEPHEQAKIGKGKPATRVLVLSTYQNFGPGRTPEDPQWKALFGAANAPRVQVLQRMMAGSTNSYNKWLPKGFSFSSPWEQFESASGPIDSDPDSYLWMLDPTMVGGDLDERLWRDCWRYPDHQRSGWDDSQRSTRGFESRTLGELEGMERRAWSLTMGCNLRDPVVDRTKLERLARNDGPM